MPDAVSPVDLASLAAAGDHLGTLWRLDGEDLQANLVRLDQGDRIEPHRNDEVEVPVVVVFGRLRSRTEYAFPPRAVPPPTARPSPTRQARTLPRICTGFDLLDKVHYHTRSWRPRQQHG